MIEVCRTEEFVDWLDDLSDRQGAAKVAARIDRLAHGNPGDVRPVGSGISELRVDYGPGYRVYFKRYGQARLVLLCAGDKRSQPRDIVFAKALAALL